MIKTIKISNYRCFRDLRIDDCRRINVIVGENGSGKSALLEAVFLAAGPSPEITLRQRGWRGFEPSLSNLEPYDESLWSDLFYKFNKLLPARIELQGTPQEHNRYVEVSYTESETQLRTSKRPSNQKVIDERSTDGAKPAAPIRFRWKSAGYHPVDVLPKISEGRLVLNQEARPPIEGYYFSGTSTYSTLEIATRFSDVSKLGESAGLVEELKKHFPYIQDLSIEISGASPIVHVSSTEFARKIPINLFSGGMTKAAAILFTVATKNKCIVLVDEIENGLYYKLMPGLWSSLISLCGEHNSQVFVSTHSQECLEALVSVASKNPDDVALFRMERGLEGSVVRQFSGDQLVAGVEFGREVR